MWQPDIKHVTTRATYDAILLDLDGMTALDTISYIHMGNEADRVHPLSLLEPSVVLAEMTGVVRYGTEASFPRDRFSQAVFPRMTNRVVYHPTPARRQMPNRSQPQQLALFEWVHTG